MHRINPQTPGKILARFAIHPFILVLLLAIPPLSLHQICSQENPSLELYTTLGYGSIRAIDWPGDNIYVRTSAGVWVYETSTLNHDKFDLSPYQETYSGSLLTAAFESDREQIVTEFEPGEITVQTHADGAHSDISFLAHSDNIITSAVYPNKDLLAVARTSLVPFHVPSGDDFDIRVWNSAIGEELFVLQAHTALVVNLVFSPNGEMLASASYDGTIRVWDMTEGEQITELQGRGPLAFSANGESLLFAYADSVFSEADSVFSYDLISNSNENNFSEIVQIDSAIAVITAASQYLSIGDEEGNIHLFDTDLEQMVSWNAHSEALTAIQFDADMSRIASSSDTELRIWDLESDTLLIDLSQGFTQPVQDVGWTDNEVVISTERWAVRVWDVNSSSQLCTYDVSLIRGDIEVGADNTLWVSDYNDVRQLIGCNTSFDDTFFAGNEIRTIAINDSGSEIAVARYGWIEIYDIESGSQIMQIDGHNESINALDFSPNGELLASGSGIVPFDVIPPHIDQTVRLWNRANGAQVAEFLGTEAPVFALAFSLDGQQLASGHADGVIQIWDIDHHTRLSTLTTSSPVTALIYYPGDNLLVSGHDNGMIAVWDVETSQSIMTLDQHHKTITTLEFDSTGPFLAVSSLDGTSSIWTMLD